MTRATYHHLAAVAPHLGLPCDCCESVPAVWRLGPVLMCAACLPGDAEHARVTTRAHAAYLAAALDVLRETLEELRAVWQFLEPRQLVRLYAPVYQALCDDMANLTRQAGPGATGAALRHGPDDWGPLALDDVDTAEEQSFLPGNPGEYGDST